MPSRLIVVLVSLLYVTTAVIFWCRRTYLTLKVRLQQLAKPSRLTAVLVSLLLATPALIFWLWLVTLPARVAVRCPLECRCDTGGYSVKCDRSSLTAVPSISLTGVQVLYILDNNITLLERDIFVSRGLTELEVLGVRRCGLSTVELGAFKGLTELRKLSLWGNKLRNITPGTFENMINLEYLDLSYNILEHLDSAVFSGLVNLQYIDLGGNQLQYLHPDMFLGLPKLQHLYLSFNPGLQIPTACNFINSHSLSHLGISHCKVSSVSVETFANLSALEWLDLRINRLQHLDSDVFSGLVNLRYIGLRGNQLQSLHPDTFLWLPKLQQLYLSVNPDLQTPTDRNFIKSHSLSRLDISECNVRSVSVETFANLSALEWLDLSLNRLQHLDSAVFSGLVNLQYINLGSNQLQYLHPDTFLGLPKLQHLYLYNSPRLQTPTDRNFIKSHSLSHLDISSCNVRSVSVETFANVSALEWLDLSYNNLRTVDINILRTLPKLSTLYLDGNRLQCDCQLQEVWRFCEDRNIRVRYGGIPPVCDTPSEVEGMWWGVLEKGQCLQGNIQYYGDYNNTRDSYTVIKDKYSDEHKVEILKKYQLPVYAVLFIFGTTCNVIILIIITCNKNMRTVPNMYIINLATSDIIYLTVFFAEACANRISDTWLQGDFMCTFIPFCRRLSVGLSVYSVAVLSIQRYRVTVNPLDVRVSSPPTWGGTVGTICGVWIVAALFAIPSALSKYLCEGLWVYNLFSYYVLNDTSEVMTYYQLVVIFELLVSCAIPLFVISFTYTMTALHLKESSRCISEGTQNPQLNTRRTTAKIVVGLTVVFMISYVPYHVIWTYVNYTKKQKVYFSISNDDLFSLKYELQYTYLISSCLLLINPCLNPVALFCTSSPFRQHLKSYLTCCCKTNSPPADLELTRQN